MNDLPPAGAAGPFDELLGRLTRRFRADPDLRLELIRELRGHLEDGAAAFRAGGLPEAEAAAAAAKALGDADALADGLWAANRGRLRARVGAAWGVRLVLGPAAAVACAAVGWGLLTTLGLLAVATNPGSERRDVITAGKGGDSSLPERVARGAWERMLAGRSEAERFFLQRPPGETDAGRAKALSDRWPADPVLYAHYALTAGYPVVNPPRYVPPTPAAVDEAVRLFDDGAAREPDNGFYPLMKAAALFAGSSHIDYAEPQEQQLGYDTADERDNPVRFTFSTLRVTDAARFDRGLAAFREGVRKPFVESHATDLADRRRSLLPEPVGLDDYLLRHLLDKTAPAVPHVVFLEVAWVAGRYAIDLAQRGRVADGLDLVGDLRRLGAAVGARAAREEDAFIASQLHFRALLDEAMIRKLAGDEAAFGQSEARVRAYIKRWRLPRTDPALARARSELEPHVGLFQSLEQPRQLDPRRVDPAPGRRAEYAVADRAGLAGLAAVLLAGAGVQAAGFAIVRRLRRADALPSLFPGWPAVLRVVGVGAGLPVAAYAGYAHLTPAGGRGYGLKYMAPWLLVEYAAVGVLVLVLLRIGIVRAVRRRAAELGLPVPAGSSPSRRGGVLFGVLWGVLVLVGLAVLRYTWPTEESDPKVLLFLANLVVGLVGAYGLYWVAVRTRPAAPDGRTPQTRRRLRLATYGLAAVPMVVWACLVTSAMTRDGSDLHDWRFVRYDTFPWQPAHLAVGTACLLVVAGVSVFNRIGSGDRRESTSPVLVRSPLGYLAFAVLPLAVSGFVLLAFYTSPRPGSWRPAYLAAAVACSAAVAGVALVRAAVPAVRRRKDPSPRPPLEWGLYARTSVTCLVLAAFVLATGGMALTRWQERRAVAGLARSGFDPLHDLNVSVYRVPPATGGEDVK